LVSALLSGDLTPGYWLEHQATQGPNLRAISDEHASLSWSELQVKVSKWGKALRRRGVGTGVRVALLADNSAYLVAAVLAIHWTGAASVLLDPSRDKAWLAWALVESKATLLLVDRESHVKGLTLPSNCQAFVAEQAFAVDASSELDLELRYRGLGSDCFVWMMTSGTTGTPRVTRITNSRAVLSGFGMGDLCLGLGSSDTIFCVLPLTHATAMLTGLCVALLTGCAFITRKRLATSTFWADVSKEHATSLMYVGEVARYLLVAPMSSGEQTHSIKVAFGNGMALDVWQRFQARFRIPKILEFYGATELPLALVNLAGNPGSMGRIALRRFSPWQIIRCDVDTGDLMRRTDGTLKDCEVNEPGELVLFSKPHFWTKLTEHLSSLVGKVAKDAALAGGLPGTGAVGMRTGDIVSCDERGYVTFVDRLFGYIRQNGHNVSTRYLECRLRDAKDIIDVGVTHVTLPHYDGQLGLVVVVPTGNFQIAALARIVDQLPDYSRPRFLRLTTRLRLNRGFKFDQAGYRVQGVDPAIVTEPLYVYSRGQFVPMTDIIWSELVLGSFRF
jgi:fatty-acyl-CoA synthase